VPTIQRWYLLQGIGARHRLCHPEAKPKRLAIEWEVLLTYVALSLCFAQEMLERAEDSPISTLGERIDPNEASAASLMRLSQISAARACEIVSACGNLTHRADLC
jgi:DNA uptake protein ComE-like DNA-binding protein